MLLSQKFKGYIVRVLVDTSSFRRVSIYPTYGFIYRKVDSFLSLSLLVCSIHCVQYRIATRELSLCKVTLLASH